MDDLPSVVHAIAVVILEAVVLVGIRAHLGLEVVDEAVAIWIPFGIDKAVRIGIAVGIELDELPIIARDLDMRLEPGMVFALEPKFIFPDTGAIGIEDTFVVSENGLEQMTYFDEALHVL